MKSKALLLFSNILLFTIIGPISLLVLNPSRIDTVNNLYAWGLIPAFLAGVFHGMALILICSNTNFLHKPYDWLRSLYIGGPLGLVSGALGVTTFFLIPYLRIGSGDEMGLIGLKIFFFPYLIIGTISGVICGLISTPITMRKYAV